MSDNFYSAQAGSENFAVVTNAAGKTITLVGALNFDTSNAKVVMMFDATALPSSGAVPLVSVPIAAAISATQPSPSSFSFPTGLTVQNGIVVACSTTAKTRTVDTTAGGNCKFLVVWK